MAAIKPHVRNIVESKFFRLDMCIFYVAYYEVIARNIIISRTIVVVCEKCLTKKMEQKSVMTNFCMTTRLAIDVPYPIDICRKCSISYKLHIL